MEVINNPHDKFFKETMSDIETTKDFMKNYLPEELLKIIDLENIIIEKDSFIEKELEEVFSDILYKVNLKGKEAYLYFLFEHKSYPYKKIALQLLKYMIKIWELKIKQGRKNGLPLIIPLVIYHGERRWNIGLKLSNLLEDIPEEIEKYVPNYQYLLYDLSNYSHEEIKGGAKLKVFLEIMRSIFKDDFRDRFKESLLVLEELLEKEKGIEYFETVVRYIMNAKEELSVKDLEEAAREISSERGGEIMTIAERLKEEGKKEGKKEGLEQGLEQGLKQGEKEGMEKLVKKLLIAKFKSVPKDYKESLKAQDKDTLEVIATKIIDMEELKEIEEYLN